MNNWSQKPYTLFPADGPGNYEKVFKQGQQGQPQPSNSFWLEPAVYLGPPVEVDDISESAGALCYRVQFTNEDMSNEWRGLYFFPRGDQPISMGPNGQPDPQDETERLQAKTTIGNNPFVISLYVDPAPATPSRFLVQVVKTGPNGGGGGWGGGHN